MRFELIRRRSAANTLAGICRMSIDEIQWRVLVESWRDGDGWRGRLLFEPDDPTTLAEPRAGPPTLRGRSREAVVVAAHEIPPRRLRELLHSLT